MKTGEENLGEEILEYLLREGELSYKDVDFPTESPIEILLLKAVRLGASLSVDHAPDIVCREPHGPHEMQVRIQHQIGKFRVDFLFTSSNVDGKLGNLVVECDGHDYHERTKEQARNDRSRDRALQEMGYTVFRFTGSEIYRSPLGCARQIFRWIDNFAFKEA